MSRIGIAVLALVVAVPLGTTASDAPHQTLDNCSGCHMGHNATGGGLTTRDGNANVCFSCHQNTPRYAWSASQQAVPGSSGTSHHWSASANGMGATAPAPGTPLGSHLANGYLQCSTCHDAHQADMVVGSPADPANLGTQHASAMTKTGTGSGTLAFTAGSPAALATPKQYRIEIVTGGTSLTTARFRLSNDKGMSWFGCTAATTYTYVAYNGSNGCQPGTGVALNDGTNVRVTFALPSGSLVAGDRWDFWVSYPFLRASVKDGAMCTTCHKDRNQTWQNADGTGPIAGTGEAIVFGTTRFSHPVGQALNQSGRTNGLAQVLDATGEPQATTTDPNASNDLVLGTGGIVTCLTCHHPHLADSNSLSDDTQ